MAESRAGAGSSCLTALGTVEDDPHRKVVREVLEAMLDACWYEQHVAWTEWAALGSVDEFAAPAHDHVQLVAGVRRLRVCTARRVDLDLHAPVPKHPREPFSARSGQVLHGLLYRNPASPGPSAGLAHKISLLRILSSRRLSSPLTSGHSSSITL